MLGRKLEVQVPLVERGIQVFEFNLHEQIPIRQVALFVSTERRTSGRLPARFRIRSCEGVRVRPAIQAVLRADSAVSSGGSLTDGYHFEIFTDKAWSRSFLLQHFRVLP